MRKKHFLFAGISLILVLTFISLKEAKELPEFELHFLDKIFHLFAYVLLALIWCSYIFYHKPTYDINKNLIIVFISLLIYGIIIEVLQEKLTSTRLFEFNDLVANLLGLLIGLLIFKYFLNFKLNSN